MKSFVAAVSVVTGSGLMLGSLLEWMHNPAVDSGNLVGFSMLGGFVLLGTFIYAANALD
jgi:hypothetical protein